MGARRRPLTYKAHFHATDLTTLVASRWGDVPIAVARACSWLAIQCHPGAPEGFGLDPNATGEAHIAVRFRAHHRRPVWSRAITGPRALSPDLETLVCGERRVIRRKVRSAEQNGCGGRLRRPRWDRRSTS